MVSISPRVVFGFVLTFIGKLANSLPAMGCNAHIAKEYALPYHPISLVLLNCEVILGIAVEIIAESKDMRKTASASPMTTRTSGSPVSSKSLAFSAEMSLAGLLPVSETPVTSRGFSSVIVLCLERIVIWDADREVERGIV